MKLEHRREGIGTGAIVAAVIVVILIAGAAYFIFAPSSTTTTTSSTTTSTTPPTSSSTTTTTSTTSVSSTTTTSSVSGATVIIPQGIGTDQSLNFEPSTFTLVVGVNNTVTFEDQDNTAPHNVWFTSVPSGATNPNTAAGQSSFYEINDGQSVTYTLTTPGTYDFECQFHSTWMQGVITVVSSTTSSSTTLSSSTTSTTSSSSSSTTSTTSSTTSTTSTTSTSNSSSAYVIVMPQGAGSGLNFSPSTITIPAGATITFMDEDSIAPHNVWFTSIPSGATNPNTAAGQSSGYELLKGDSVSYTLTTPGTYSFECQFHSTWMLGTITVTG